MGYIYVAGRRYICDTVWVHTLVLYLCTRNISLRMCLRSARTFPFHFAHLFDECPRSHRCQCCYAIANITQQQQQQRRIEFRIEFRSDGNRALQVLRFFFLLSFCKILSPSRAYTPYTCLAHKHNCVPGHLNVSRNIIVCLFSSSLHPSLSLSTSFSLRECVCCVCTLINSRFRFKV